MVDTEKFKFKDKEYTLDTKDALLVMAIIDLTDSIKLLVRKI